MTITQLSKKLGVDVATLKYIAHKGAHPMLAARHTGKTRCVYVVNDIEVQRYLNGESEFNIAKELRRINYNEQHNADRQAGR